MPSFDLKPGYVVPDDWTQIESLATYQHLRGIRAPDYNGKRQWARSTGLLATSQRLAQLNHATGIGDFDPR